MLEFSPSGWLSDAAGIDPGVQARILRSLIAFAVIWLAHRLLLKYTVSRIDDGAVRYRTRKTAGYVAVLLGFLVIGRIWYDGVGSLATFLGLLSAGVAIALGDLVASFAGWLFIIWRRPFEVGDRIQIGDNAGDVIDQRIFQFTMLEIGNWVDADQTTGRLIYVPNASVFRQPLANYGRGIPYIWNEIPVLLTFESDWQGAKRILEGIARITAADIGTFAAAELQRASGRFFLGQLDIEPRVYTTVQDSGVLLTLRYLCDPRKRRASAEQVWEAILVAFAEHDDIDFAYPTIRYYDNRSEGKEGARAPMPPIGH